MPSSLGQPPLSEAPLYIRWGPDRCPYAIELKLELVDRLRRALNEAGSAGAEIGGVLIGSLPTSQTPTLRIEDVELLVRRAEDGLAFALEGSGGERFAEVRLRARAKERSTVGLFRSHLRSGPLRPALADRTLLASEFKEPVYALLLVQGLEPFDAAFFVASNGPLPAEISVRAFQLDPVEFSALPEIETEVPGTKQLERSPSSNSGVKTTAAVLLVAVCVLGAIYYFNQSLFPAFAPSSNSLRLDLRSQEGLLCLSWNHDAAELNQATGADLSVLARGTRLRKVHLGLDELRLGVIALESESARLDVVLTVDHPGAGYTKHSATWTR